MIRINALYFLLLLEALILMSGLSAYLYLRLRKERSVKTVESSKQPVSPPSLKDHVEACLMSMQQTDAGGDGHAAGGPLRETQSFLLRFVSIALDGAGKYGDSPVKFWDHLLGGYREITEDIIRTKRELLSEIETLRESQKALQDAAGAGNTESGDKVSDNAQTAITAENIGMKAEITRLVENIDTKARQLSELQARFDSLEQEYLVLYKESLN